MTSLTVVRTQSQWVMTLAVMTLALILTVAEQRYAVRNHGVSEQSTASCWLRQLTPAAKCNCYWLHRCMSTAIESGEKRL